MDIHVKTLLIDLGKMEETDVTIYCQKREEVKANSYILKARSPVFKAMLNANMKESKTHVIELVLYTKKAVSLLLEYMRNACLPSDGLSISVLVEVYQLADCYALDELKNHTHTLLSKLAANMSDAITILRYWRHDPIKTIALNTIDDAIRKSSCIKKVRLGNIDDNIMVMMFNFTMEKSILVEK